MWTYKQSTGQLFGPDGDLEGTGYSGHAQGHNNPALQAVHNVGPIPQGRYVISGAHDTETHGPLVMALLPVGHDAFGRSGFLMHGDNLQHDASLGCIIMGHVVREVVSESRDRLLQVVA